MITIQQKYFLELVKAGLWTVNGEGFLEDPRGKTRRTVHGFSDISWEEMYRLAEEQSVVGLVAAGLGTIPSEERPPQTDLLRFIGNTLQIEQRNRTMNELVAKLIDLLRKNDVYAILVKGQGIAQCYERPLWRSCGDVDLFLSDDNYKAAKEVLTPIADDVAVENKTTKHQAFVINGFDVELHGRMPFTLSKRADKVVDEAQRNVFYGGNVRSWTNGSTTVFLPSPDNDVIFVFTHFLLHFFIEGVGLRQICDWCRLLWTYRSELDLRLLESRIRKAGLMTEWKAFAALAVNYLGMVEEAMPLYDSRLKHKGEKVLERVLKSGNFGHNNDLSYRAKYKGMKYKMVAMWRRFWDFASLVPVFPVDAPKFFVNYLFAKVK